MYREVSESRIICRSLKLRRSWGTQDQDLWDAWGSEGPRIKICESWGSEGPRIQILELSRGSWGGQIWDFCWISGFCRFLTFLCKILERYSQLNWEFLINFWRFCDFVGILSFESKNEGFCRFSCFLVRGPRVWVFLTVFCPKSRFKGSQSGKMKKKKFRHRGTWIVF